MYDDHDVLQRSRSHPVSSLLEDAERAAHLGARCVTPYSEPGIVERTTSAASMPSSRNVSTPTQLGRTTSRSNTGVMMRTSSGFQVGLMPPEQLRELQCSICASLIQSAVHAPCGHSFCQFHLEADDSARNELEVQAQRIRDLTVGQGFSLARARQALAAVGDGPIEKAVEVCAKLSGLEGRAVRVRPDVKQPKFDWGLISPVSVGVVSTDEPSQDGDRQAWVAFPAYNSWHCLTEELEIHPVADRVRKGAFVHFIPGVTPKNGWGTGRMEVDGIGQVFNLSGCKAYFVFDEGIGCAFADQLQVVDATDNPLATALDRLQAGLPKPRALAQLHGFLKEAGDAADGDSICLMAHGTEYQSFHLTYGLFETLRAVGLDYTHYTKASSYIFTPIPGQPPVPPRARMAVEELRKRLEASGSTLPDPEMQPRHEVVQQFRIMLQMDPEFLMAGISVEELYQDQLRQQILLSIAPQGENWSWTQRGWNSEQQMLSNLQNTLPLGSAAIARKQTKEEIEKIVGRLTDQGLSAVVEEEPVQDPVAAAECERLPSCPEGALPRGARVRFTKRASGVLPDAFDLCSIGTIIGQVFSGDTSTGNARSLHYYVSVPKYTITKPVPATIIEHAPRADEIQPGVRVRVNPPGGREPAFGWRTIQGSDIGVVQNVLVDGTVDVFFMALENFWRGALHDLDARDLPQVARTDCPVCFRPFPSGQKLAVDIAVDAQIKRLQKLVAGARLERNDSGRPKSGSKKPNRSFMRSNSHQEELRCNICFDLLIAPVTLPCGHSYCKHHIQIWLLESDKCPVCRIRVLHYKDHPAQPKHALRTTAAVFQASLEDEDGKGGAKPDDDGLELHVNEMLEKQVIRFFPKEVQQRSGEVASEVWEAIQKRQDGCLGRLRNFLEQFQSDGIVELMNLGLEGPDQPLPGTGNGSLLMMACELGLLETAQTLLDRKADPLHTTEAAFGPGTSALQLAAGQGRTSVAKMLLQSTKWPSQLCADALGCAIERDQGDCAELLLQEPVICETRNCMDFTAMLTAVQAGHAQIVSRLIDWNPDLEARTAHSGLMISKAGVVKVNGPYQQVGEMNGRPLYANLLGAVVFCHDWWKIAESKVVAETGAGFIYSMPSPHSSSQEPPAGQWTMDGVRPDPSRLPPMPAPVVERLAEAGQAATPLLLAAQLGLGNITDLLLRARADIDARLPTSERSALHIAATVGDVGVLKSLLDGLKAMPGANISHVLPRDAANLTPLHLACHAGHTIAVRTLLEAGAPPDGGDPSSGPMPTTPLVVAAACGLHLEVGTPGASGAYLAIVIALLDAKADPSQPGTLQVAAAAGNVAVVTALVERGAPPSLPDASGCPPLVAALLKGSQVKVHQDGAHSSGPQSQASLELLRLSADANARRENDGFTALMAAAALGDVALIAELVKGGADITATRGSLMAAGFSTAACAKDWLLRPAGWSVIDSLLADVPGVTETFPGGVLCPRGHAMERLAKERCNRRPVCDCCRRTNIQTGPVFWTCWPCDHDLCIGCAGVAPIVSLPCGLDPSNLATDTSLPSKFREAIQSEVIQLSSLEGWQALHHAVATGRKNAVVALLEAKALPAAPDAQGRTPLHLAALFGYGAIVCLLLENSADPAALDESGKPPLAFLTAETLRYSFEAEETGFTEARAHEIEVIGTGPADGEYSRLLGDMLSRSASEGGTGTAPSPEPAMDGESLAGEGDPTRESFRASSPTPGSDAGTEAVNRRPTYRKKDGSPFVVKWTENDGWGVFQVRGAESCVFKSTNSTALRCPLHGWSAVEGFQHPDGFDAQSVRIKDTQPWCAGTLLLNVTPKHLHPPTLKQDVEALPPLDIGAAIESQAMASIQLGHGITIPVPPGMLASGSPSPDQLFQTMMEEMMRRGGPMPMPGGGAVTLPNAPGCPQQ